MIQRSYERLDTDVDNPILPKGLKGHGPFSRDWSSRELRWVGVNFANERPFFGNEGIICLTARLSRNGPIASSIKNEIGLEWEAIMADQRQREPYASLRELGRPKKASQRSTNQLPTSSPIPSSEPDYGSPRTPQQQIRVNHELPTAPKKSRAGQSLVDRHQSSQAPRLHASRSAYSPPCSSSPDSSFHGASSPPTPMTTEDCPEADILRATGFSFEVLYTALTQVSNLCAIWYKYSSSKPLRLLPGGSSAAVFPTFVSRSSRPSRSLIGKGMRSFTQRYVREARTDRIQANADQRRKVKRPKHNMSFDNILGQEVASLLATAAMKADAGGPIKVFRPIAVCPKFDVRLTLAGFPDLVASSRSVHYEPRNEQCRHAGLQ